MAAVGYWLSLKLMPELPEVETIKRQLNRAVVGKRIDQIQVLRQKSFQGSPKKLVGKKVKTVDRRAKLLIIYLAKKFPAILIHLKMTGQLIFKGRRKRLVGGHPTLDWISQLPTNHTRAIITFRDKTQLFFNDMRVFGWLKAVENQKQLDRELKGVEGVEPLTDEFTTENLKKQLGRTGRAIKIALMDQKLIAGVGNIYANDALWDAKINPRKPAKGLTDKEINRLQQSIERVIKKGIKYGGASDSDYKQLNGMGGKYQKHFLVYKQDGKKCRRCQRAKIKKTKLSGRGTYFCPVCQEKE